MGAPVAVRHLSPQRYHADASSMCAPMLVSPSAAAKVGYRRGVGSWLPCSADTDHGERRPLEQVRNGGRL